MKQYCDEWIKEWCLENGWTDLQIKNNQYWALRPGAFIPEPIPCDLLREIKSKQGLSQTEEFLSTVALITTIVSLMAAILFSCPALLIIGFGIDSLAFAALE